jgi:hypothetical protein
MHRIDSAGDDDDFDSDETSSLDSSVKPVVVKEEAADVEEFADHGNVLGEEDLLNSATFGLRAGVSDTGNGNDNNSAEKLQCVESDSSEVAKTKKKRRVKSTMKTPKEKRASVSSTVTPSSIQQSVHYKKQVAKMISPEDEPYSIITNDVALELLQSKFGIKVEG